MVSVDSVLNKLQDDPTGKLYLRIAVLEAELEETKEALEAETDKVEELREKVKESRGDNG